MPRKKKTETVAAETTEKTTSGDICLRHTVWSEGEKTVYFYEGELVAKDGVVCVPADRPEWVRRAWVLGYRLDPDSGENKRLEDLIEI